jgi:CheY-like chemotaxis protein
MDRLEDVVIVLAEDDPGHARLIEKNLRSILANRIVRFANGQETLDYLRGEGQEPQQHVLLLDLNMPVMDGYQVLEQLKADPRTALMPVIVLTSADDPREIQRCYDLGCNAYVVKSGDFEVFTEAIRGLGLFLTVARMPWRGVTCRLLLFSGSAKVAPGEAVNGSRREGCDAIPDEPSGSVSPEKRWFSSRAAQTGDPTVADSILDRLVHDVNRIELKGESMR